jgi:hypothetical protein
LVTLLANKRLVVTGDLEAEKPDTAEITHEALITAWHRLSEWVEADRQFRIWQERTRETATEWVKSDANGLPRDEGILLRGARLAESIDWLERRPSDVGLSERDLIGASLALRDQEYEEQQRAIETAQRLIAAETERAEAAEALASKERQSRTQLRLLLGIVSSLLVVAISLGGYSLLQGNEARRQQSIAQSRELSATALSLLSIDPQQALLLAIEGWTEAPTVQAEHAVRESLQASHIRAILRGHTGRVWAAAFSPDGSRVITTSSDGTARLWDATTGMVVNELRIHTGPVRAAAVRGALSSDGSRLIFVSDDGTARVWDTTTGAAMAELRGRPHSVFDGGFSPDGSLVVTNSGSFRLQVWDAMTGVAVVEMRGHRAPVQQALFSRDGSRMVTASADGTARVWDVKTGAAVAELRGYQVWVSSAAFSPDGSRVVTASEDGTARVWDATTGAAVAELRGHTGPVRAAAFSPDGSRVVTASDDRTAMIHPWVTFAPREVLLEVARPNVVRTLSDEERRLYLPWRANP